MSVQVGIINTWNNGKKPDEAPFCPSTKLRYEGRGNPRKKHIFEERLIRQSASPDESSSKMDTTGVTSLLR